MTVQSKYLRVFLEEGAEILSKLNQRIFSLEQDPKDHEALQSALRLFHTLKGGAKMVGLDNVSRAAHEMETSLETLITRGRTLTASECSALLQTLDRIHGVFDLVSRGRQDEALGLDPSAPGCPVGRQSVRTSPSVPKGNTSAAESRDGELSTRPQGETPRRLGIDRVRVSVEKLDALQNLVDDLMLQKVRILEHMDEFRKAFDGLDRVAWESDDRDLAPAGREKVRRVIRLLSGRGFATYLEELHGLDQLLAEIQAQVFELRMVPVAELLEEQYRTVRTVAQELGKDVELTLDGKFTEIDKRLLEAIRAPLMHLVRNAVGHGVETPEERVGAGKPATARVTIRAYHKASAVILEVEDDGRGLDPDHIRRSAVERGVVSDETARALPDSEVFYLLCEPGFTTRDDVTELSGRGVGLDVVKVGIEKLQGSLVIRSETGTFTQFRMYLPLSISSLSALIVRAGECLYALPSLFVEGCFKVDTSELTSRSGMWTYRSSAYPVISLARALGLGTQTTPDRTGLVAFQFRGRTMILQVDELLDEREIVFRSLGTHLREVPFVLGVSILSDGRPLPVLNVADLQARWPTLEATSRFQPGAAARPARILVVDDSVTTRHMECNVLESMGYEVVQAADGIEAWTILGAEQVDLLLTDIQMPGMDGLELTRRIRDTTSLANLPVVAVSHRTEDEDLQAGFLAGVDAYICKDRFSQRKLNETLQALQDRMVARAAAVS